MRLIDQFNPDGRLVPVVRGRPRNETDEEADEEFRGYPDGPIKTDWESPWSLPSSPPACVFGALGFALVGTDLYIVIQAKYTNHIAIADLDRERRMLTELAERLRTQDNYATAWPIYYVQVEKRQYVETDNDIPHVWMTEDFEGVYSEEEIRRVIANDEFDPPPPDTEIEDIDPTEYGYVHMGYITYWETETAHLTEAAAKEYMAANMHNLRPFGTDPRMYVGSQHRCPEWQQLIEFLKERL